jgi:hypothetical protein
LPRLAILITVVVVALAAALPASATRTVRVKSSVTLGPNLRGGKVSSPKKVCIAGRVVVVRYRDAAGQTRRLGAGISERDGAYSILVTDPNGRSPHGFTATVEARRGRTAGTTYVCRWAVSRPG